MSQFTTDANGWTPIDAVFLDEKFNWDEPIWAYYDHDAAVIYDGESLTEYGFYAETGDVLKGQGQCKVLWRDGYEDDESGEGWGPWTKYPGCWFVDDGDYEIAVPVTHFRQLPPPPVKL